MQKDSPQGDPGIKRPSQKFQTVSRIGVDHGEDETCRPFCADRVLGVGCDLGREFLSVADDGVLLLGVTEDRQREDSQKCGRRGIPVFFTASALISRPGNS